MGTPRVKAGTPGCPSDTEAVSPRCSPVSFCSCISAGIGCNVSHTKYAGDDHCALARPLAPRSVSSRRWTSRGGRHTARHRLAGEEREWRDEEAAGGTRPAWQRTAETQHAFTPRVRQRWGRRRLTLLFTQNKRPNSEATQMARLIIPMVQGKHGERGPCSGPRQAKIKV